MSCDGEDWANAFEHGNFDSYLHHEFNTHEGDISNLRERFCSVSEQLVEPRTGLEHPGSLSSLDYASSSSTTASTPDCGSACNGVTTSNIHQEECDDGDGNSKGKWGSEKKRSREKQRRSDLNQQFSELKELLAKIEESEDGHATERKKRRKSRAGSAKNRQDLVAHTIDVLHHLHDKNHERITEIRELKNELRELKLSVSKAASDAAVESSQNKPEGKQDQVSIMMMPMVMPSSSSMSGVSVANQMAMCNPMMQMQQFMAHMTSQMPYPFMAPLAFPSAQMPSQQQPFPMNVPYPFLTPPVTVPSTAGGSANLLHGAGSLLPNNGPMSFPNGTQQQQQALSSSVSPDEPDGDHHLNNEDGSSNLAHCA